MLNKAEEVCPTKTRRLISDGALLVDVREPAELLVQTQVATASPQ